ncbi:DUF3558 family protein [Gordonia sp. (in: high G+C Gram-positive bacteria)]|uniref:DUF3558 family protein n=1 Tax=Gordonia sp. (in: high G+C Gram-positive bacteria) TaxID=84139 RepID=UPI003C78C783
MPMQSARPGIVLALSATAVAFVVGCSSMPASNVGPSSLVAAAPSSSWIRQQDDSGRNLPFNTVHPHRWSHANNGTDYEPCTALGNSELEGLGINTRTAEDAAGTDGQTLRGCIWQYATSEDFPQWRVTQIVGNSPSLAVEKSLKSASVNTWLPDRVIGGRQVGVHFLNGLQSCDTYVQSGGAAVSTIAAYSGRGTVPQTEICDRALVFTAATISKMPL